jgi:hypothetical protein
MTNLDTLLIQEIHGNSSRKRSKEKKEAIRLLFDLKLTFVSLACMADSQVRLSLVP